MITTPLLWNTTMLLTLFSVPLLLIRELKWLSLLIGNSPSTPCCALASTFPVTTFVWWAAWVGPNMVQPNPFLQPQTLAMNGALILAMQPWSAHQGKIIACYSAPGPGQMHTSWGSSSCHMVPGTMSGVCSMWCTHDQRAGTNAVVCRGCGAWSGKDAPRKLFPSLLIVCAQGGIKYSFEVQRGGRSLTTRWIDREVVNYWMRGLVLYVWCCVHLQ